MWHQAKDEKSSCVNTLCCGMWKPNYTMRRTPVWTLKSLLWWKSNYHDLRRTPVWALFAVVKNKLPYVVLQFTSQTAVNHPKLGIYLPSNLWLLLRDWSWCDIIASSVGKILCHITQRFQKHKIFRIWQIKIELAGKTWRLAINCHYRQRSRDANISWVLFSTQPSIFMPNRSLNWLNCENCDDDAASMILPPPPPPPPPPPRLTAKYLGLPATCHSLIGQINHTVVHHWHFTVPIHAKIESDRYLIFNAQASQPWRLHQGETRDSRCRQDTPETCRSKGCHYYFF